MDTMVEAAHTAQAEAAHTAQAKAAQTAQAKDEFFAAGMYMFHVTGFPQQSGVLTQADGRAARRAAGSVAHRPGRQRAHSRPGRRARPAQHAGLLAGEQREPHPERPEEVVEGRTRRRRARRRPPGRNGAGQPQVDVQRPLADAGGAGLAAVAQRGHTGGAAHLRQARVRRHLLRPVLPDRAGRQEVPEGPLRRQRPRQPVQGLLRGRGLRDPAIPDRSRRRRQRAPVLQGRRRQPHLPAQDQRGRPRRRHLRRPGGAHQDDQRDRASRRGRAVRHRHVPRVGRTPS